MYKVILKICLILLCLSCEDFENVEDDINPELNFIENFTQKSEIDDAIEIDFSLFGKDLLADIESKLGRSICDGQAFVAQFSLRNTDIYFNAFMKKDCQNYLPGCYKGLITTVINNSGEVLSEGIPFESYEKLSQSIYLFTKERCLDRMKEHQEYEFYWNPKTDQAITKEVLYALLKGNELYKTNHGNQKATIVLSTRPYQPPPPPPPLPLEYQE